MNQEGGSVVRHEPESAYDLYARGTEMLTGGHPHQAANLLSRAKALEPDKASIREALARAFFQTGRLASARREFAKAVSIDPVNDYAHFGLGLACARTGQRSRALAHLKLAVAMRPEAEDYRRALDRYRPPPPEGEFGGVARPGPRSARHHPASEPPKSN